MMAIHAGDLHVRAAPAKSMKSKEIERNRRKSAHPSHIACWRKRSREINVNRRKSNEIERNRKISKEISGNPTKSTEIEGHRMKSKEIKGNRMKSKSYVFETVFLFYVVFLIIMLVTNQGEKRT